MELLRLGEWIFSINPSTKPSVTVIEVSAKCNLRCKHCFRNVARDKLDIMDRELAFRVLREAKEAGVKRIVFTGWGEPLIHPDILDIIGYAKNMGFEVVVNTNGVLLNDFAKHLVELRVDELFVSVEGFSWEVYTKFRGVDQGKVIDGLMALREERIRRGTWKPMVTLLFTLTRLNYHELEHATEFASKVGAGTVIVSNYIPLSCEDEAKLACYNDPLCRETVELFAPKLGADVFRSYVQVQIPALQPKIERRCPYAANSALFIGWDGMVSPCMAYAHSWSFCLQGVQRRVERVVYGHVSEGLLNIWKKKEYMLLRLRVYTGLMPSCLDCRLKDYCDYTLSNEADCWGWRPSCAFCPFMHGLSTCPL